MNYDTAKLRQFINEFFGTEDLRTLLFDYFRPVHDDLTDSMTKSRQISLLLEYCHNLKKFPDLLSAIQRERDFFQPDDYVQGQKAPTAAPPTSTPITRNPRQIFISHAHQDAEVAQRLAHDLEAHGYDIWIAPDSIRPGEKWVEAINRGLEESGIFVLLLSPDAVASRWVNMETNAAIEFEDEGKMQFYPLMLNRCRLPALWRAFQYISLLDGYELGVQALINVLKPADTDLATGAFIRDPKTGEVTMAALPVRNQNFIDQRTGKEFIYIPAGEFLFGEGKKKLYLAEFWIAKTPVTNAEYARFVAEKRTEPPKHWQGDSPPADILDHPVVYVSWHDAKAYADWAGLELPTEEQWEKAARGTEGKRYPWGDDWRTNHCNTREAGIGETSPVGQFSPQGDSPFGCVDMSGNVWEWMVSPYPKGNGWHVVRGGSWNDASRNARSVARDGDAPDNRLNVISFRTVLRKLPPLEIE